MKRIFAGLATVRRLRRGAARMAIAALIANIALPVIAALSFAAAGPAASSPFPICSAHAALIDAAAPGSSDRGGSTARPLGCPLCPAPLPLDIPTAPPVYVSVWMGVFAPPPTAVRAFPPFAKPSPVWSHAPPFVS